MVRCDPQPGETISLDSKTYEFLPHPVFADAAYGQEGRKGVVYQVQNNGSLFALKSFKEAYRDQSLHGICRCLAQLDLPGMEVCRRECLTSDWAAAALSQFPDFEYAVLMPWIEGSTWFELVSERTVISDDASLAIAQNTCRVLSKLEARGFAHCDVAGSNVIVDPRTGAIHFIDVEDMYGPGLQLADSFPQGTVGYQHRSNLSAKRGQWCGEGDRFAGGVLLAEMLTWHDQEIRDRSDREQYFAESELQEDNERYRLMLEKLSTISKGLVSCFQRLWESDSLADCPSLSEWEQLLQLSVVTEWQPIDPPPPRPPYQPKFVPIPLPAPAFLRVYSESSPVSIHWEEVPRAAGYILEASPSGRFDEADRRLYSGPKMQFGGLQVGEESSFVRVCAFDEAGNGGDWRSLEIKEST